MNLKEGIDRSFILYTTTKISMERIYSKRPIEGRVEIAWKQPFSLQRLKASPPPSTGDGKNRWSVKTTSYGTWDRMRMEIKRGSPNHKCQALVAKRLIWVVHCSIYYKVIADNFDQGFTEEPQHPKLYQIYPALQKWNLRSPRWKS